MANKKVRFIFTIILFIFLIVNLKQASFVSAEEKKVDMVKVKRYIENVGKLFKENPDVFGWDSVLENKYLNLVKEINLSDEEIIEVARVISKEIDLKKYEKYPYMKEEEIGTNDFAKYCVYSFAVINLMQKWKKTLPADEVIISKIMPLIKTNDELKTTWIAMVNEFSISDEIRPKVMDELIKIFSDKNNTIEVRFEAAYVWSSREEREEKAYEGFDILLKDEDVFEKVGTNLWFLNDIDMPAPQIYDKMFLILENREKYSLKIINGAFDFFQRDSGNFWGDKDGKIRQRLKKALKEIIEKDKDTPYKEKSKGMLLYIEKKEKEGVYK
jgi:hypothetical protein